KSIRRLPVSPPRLDAACIDRPNSLIRVWLGGLSSLRPQPKCWTSTEPTFLLAATANWYCRPRHEPIFCPLREPCRRLLVRALVSTLRAGRPSSRQTRGRRRRKEVVAGESSPHVCRLT